MTWQEIRMAFPSTWLLVEAQRAKTQDGIRQVDDFGVVGKFTDSESAMTAYSQLHHENRERELYVLHTSRITPDIRERSWHGIRIAH